MASISLGKKYLLLSNFTSIPKTAVIEEAKKQLQKTYDEFVTYEKSEELKKFYDLEKYINSIGHKNKLAEFDKIKKEEKDKENLYASQKKSKEFKKFFKFKASQKLKDFYTFEKSNDLKRYFELEELINSSEFKADQEKATSKKNEFISRENELKLLQKNSDLKKYFKIKKSGKLARYNQIIKGNKIKEFNELDELVNTAEFKNKIAENTKKELKYPEEKKKYEQFNKLKKDSDLKFYFKYQKSAPFLHFQKTSTSSELKKYQQLVELIDSSEFKNDKSKTEKNVEELQSKLNDFQKLKKDKKIKWFFKFQQTPSYSAFVSFEKSKQLVDYLELESYLSSEERKSKLATLDKNEGEEKKILNDFETYKKSEKYNWYLKLKDKNDFESLLAWKLIFEDDFNENKLNTDIWSTRYYQGEQLLKDAYVLEGEKAFLTDGKNITIDNGSLKINVKKEKTEGKVWKPPFGFTPQEFDYTSGIINSSKGIKEQYGKIEAKIKIDYTKALNFNFWLAGEMVLPHVDILKVEDKKSKIKSGHHWGDTKEQSFNSSSGQFSGLNPSSDYFIYSLEWSAEKMIWKINGIVVNEQSNNIPKEKMYLVFSAGIKGKVSDSSLPSAMEIDWVRWYKKS